MHLRTRLVSHQCKVQRLPKCHCVSCQKCLSLEYVKLLQWRADGEMIGEIPSEISDQIPDVTITAGDEIVKLTSLQQGGRLARKWAKFALMDKLF